MKMFLCLIILQLSLSCTAQHNTVSVSNDYNIVINIAINDFYKTSSLLKDDKIFSVSYKNVDNNIIQVNIIGNPNKFYIENGKPLNRLPTKYIEYNDKIFYWSDDGQDKLDSSIINKFQQYGLIERNADIIEYNIDDKKKGVSYFFCKENLTRYKKIKSNLSITKPPKINCK
ncbi:hypothetical protein [Chryseobacterium sp.]|uniref:hypothetical protein n=1 Tax=Chryseobacterium sp. TaxID=1871047 RepID=UPI0012BE12E5|nr:hypothetical protein [Chryseobacterium sp.]MPS66728.1 hypothetical protein [Chryseobacterium sp.]